MAKRRKDITRMYTTCMIQMPLVVRESADSAWMRTPEDIFNLCREIGDFAVETFHVISVNRKNCLINRSMITTGILDSSLVHAREVFRQAVIDGAAAVILVHNHPSGDPTPSAEDIRITRQLIAAGQIMDIKILDHVVMGNPRNPAHTAFCSMREAGFTEFVLG